MNKLDFIVIFCLLILCGGCRFSYISITTIKDLPWSNPYQNYGVSDFEYIIDNDSIEKRSPKLADNQNDRYWHTHIDYIYHKKIIRRIRKQLKNNIYKKHSHKLEYRLPVLSKPVELRKAMQKYDIRFIAGGIDKQTAIMTENITISQGSKDVNLGGYPPSISRLIRIKHRIIFHKSNPKNNDTLYMGNGNTHIFLWDKRSEMFRYKNFILFKNHYCQVKDGFDIYDILNPKEFADSGKCHIW